MQRRQRFVSDQRWDLPQYDNMLELIEQEFQHYAQGFVTPTNKILRNFVIENGGGLVARVNITNGDSALFNTERSGNEDINLRKSTETQLTITLADNATNYVEVQVFEMTGAADVVALWDPTANGGDGEEFTQTVDTCLDQDTQLVSNTIAFTGDSDKLPLAEVVTAGGVITSITDAREPLFHLASDFNFGSPRSDMQIRNIKEMFDSITTRLKEVAGTTNWYDAPAGSGLSLLGLLERFNYNLVDGGTLSWDATTGDLDWTAALRIIVASRAFNYTISAQTVTAIADGEVVYVTLPDVGVAPGGPLAVSKTSSATYAISTTADRNYILAYRSGTKIYFGNGWQGVELEDDESIELGDGINAALIALLGSTNESSTNLNFGTPINVLAADSVKDAIEKVDSAAAGAEQFKTYEHETDLNKVRVTSPDKTLRDSAILSQELTDKIAENTDAIVNFTTGVITDGSLAALGANFVPQVIPAGEYFWYAINVVDNGTSAINKTMVQLQVTGASATNAVQGLAPLPSFPTGSKKIAAVQVHNNAGSIEVVSVRRLGAGSGGGGSPVEIQFKGATLTLSVTKINFKGSVKVTEPVPNEVDVLIGGGGGASLYYDLVEEEVNRHITEEPLNFLEPFKNQNKGTHTNLEIVGGSETKLSGSNLTGSYERNREVTTTVGSAEAIITAGIRGLRPQNSGIAGVDTVTFTGDLTGYFAVGKFLVTYRSLTTDGKPSYIWLTNPDNNGWPEIFEIDSVTYNVGLDETEVVVLNPDSLDITMGVADGSQNDQLRFAPWNYTVEGKATAGAYEPMDFVDAHGTDETVLFGQNFLALVGLPTGKVMSSNPAVSPDGTQIVIRVLEANAGNTAWYWIVSQDSGNSWASAGSRATDPAITTNDEEVFDAGQGFYQMLGKKAVVTNSGMAVAVYSTTTMVRAIRIDLGALTLTDFVTNGAGAGIVVSTGGNNQRGHIAADPDDLSFVVVTSIDDSVVATSYVYTAAGATFVESEQLGTIVSYADGFSHIVTGTGAAHFYHVVYYNTSTGKANYRRYSQASSAYGSVVATTIAGNHVVQSVTWDLANDRALLYAVQNISAAGLTYHVFDDITGTPTLGAQYTLFPSTQGIEGDVINNWKAVAQGISLDNTDNKIVVDPSDPDHIFAVMNVQHPGGSNTIKEPFLVEIPDITTFATSAVAQYSNDGSDTPLRSASSLTMIGQTFTLAGSTIRAVGVNIAQIGKVASGKVLNLSIYNTAAGIPTTLIATSPITLDPSKIARGVAGSQGSWYYFTFDTVALASLTGVYAFVLSGDYTINASNYITIYRNVANPYAGGTEVRFNGTVWAATAANDYVFDIREHWVNNLEHGHTADRFVSQWGVDEWHATPQLKLLDSTNIEYSVRRGYRTLDGAGTLFNSAHTSGHVLRRTIGVTGGGAKATISSSEVVGYGDNYDEFLIWAVSCGHSDYRRKNVETGADDLDSQAEDRSGHSRVWLTTATVAADYTSDVDFESGRCLILPGTTPNLALLEKRPERLFQNSVDPRWIIEIEYKPTAGSLSTLRTLIAKCPTGVASGWDFRHTATGFLEFAVAISGAAVLTTASSNVLTVGVCEKLLAWFDPADNKVHLGKVVAGVKTEVSTYAAQPTITVANASFGTDSMTIGQNNSSAQDALGRVGLIKIAVGATSFANNNYNEQFQPPIRPFFLLNNGGTPLVIGEQMVGRNGETDEDLSFDRLVAMQPQANEQAFGDERLQVLTYQKFLDTEGEHPHFKVNFDRVSAEDDTFLAGLHAQFRKLG